MITKQKRQAVRLCAAVVCLVIGYNVFISDKSKSIRANKPIQGQSDSTGFVFKGDIVRRYDGERIIFNDKISKSSTNSASCTKWGVMTTIFAPSEAVRRFIYLHHWCLVVVGDVQSPAEYEIVSSRLRKHHAVYLSLAEQERFSKQFSKVIPLNSFGRKNIGYLYAIKQGANVIWDFDDDNYIKFWMDGAAPDPGIFLDSHNLQSRSDNVTVSLAKCDQNNLFFNPYTNLGATVSNAWPRGFPISNVKLKMNCSVTQQVVRPDKIGILQSLADHQPDVDAIFRMTVQDKFYFDSSRVVGMSEKSNYMLLSNRLYSPTNAQATPYFFNAFPTLYLPVTVPGRVSDIWRSYIGQGILSLYGIHTGFLRRALVDQNRNTHSFDADFQSELDLYTKTKSFVTSIDYWVNDTILKTKTKTVTIRDLITDLYIYLYERKFIERDDIRNVQIWLRSIGTENHEHSLLQYSNIFGKPILSDKINLEASKCASAFPKPLTFWTSDLHDGCRLDIPTTLDFLGQKTIIAGIKRNETPYPEVFRKPHIDAYSGRLSDALMSYRTFLKIVSNEEVKNSALFFKSLSQFKQVDAIFCSFPAPMCQLWFPFNTTKSVIFLPAHRYNLGRCTFESWSLLNKQLHELYDNDGVSGINHVIGAVSRYDLEYLRHYTGLTGALLVPSFSGFYTNPYEYIPKHKEVLLISSGIPKYLQTLKNISIIHYREKYKHYSLTDIASHPALIFIPYSVMSFKFTEFYSLSIPLFVPSPKLFMENGGLGLDRASTSSLLCYNKNFVNKMPKSPKSFHSYDPNIAFENSPEDEMYWLQFSDFYDFPHVNYFDNATDLEQKLIKTDLNAVHLSLTIENTIRRQNVLQIWCDIIHKIQKART